MFFGSLLLMPDGAELLLLLCLCLASLRCRLPSRLCSSSPANFGEVRREVTVATG